MDILLKYAKHLEIDWYNTLHVDKNDTLNMEINRTKTYWTSACKDYISKLDGNTCVPFLCSLFGYIKSCEYSEKLIEKKVQEFNIENVELKSLVYGMLDENNEFKEHNRRLSERIELLENKPPILLY